jgi:hypothetical protein
MSTFRIRVQLRITFAACSQRDAVFPGIAQIMRPIGALGFGVLRRDGTSKRSIPRYDEQPRRTAAEQCDDIPCVCWSGLVGFVD